MLKDFIITQQITNPEWLIKLALVMVIFLVALTLMVKPASAQETEKLLIVSSQNTNPILTTSLTGVPVTFSPGITSPTTGTAITSSTTGVTVTPIPNITLPTPDTPTGNSVTAEPDSTNGLSESSNESTVNVETLINTNPSQQAFTRFEIRQKARIDLSGTLEVLGPNFGQSVPYSVAKGEEFTVFSLFPGQTGKYLLNLNATGKSDPILWIEGELTQIADGSYRHQFINGDASPEILELTPESDGLVISVGSVLARLNSCVTLSSPVNGVFELGVDQDGDGEISNQELVTLPLESTNSACVKTREVNIPLTSLYKSQITGSEGDVIAKNTGLYDFLNKSAIDSNKESQVELVKEFKVHWIRTPVAASIPVRNDSLRPPAVEFIVIPAVEEVTGDIIQNGAHNSGYNEDSDEVQQNQLIDADNSDTGFLLGFMIDHWLWLTLGGGFLVAIYLIAKTIITTHFSDARRS